METVREVRAVRPSFPFGRLKPIGREPAERWPALAAALGLSAGGLAMGQLARRRRGPLAMLLKAGGPLLAASSLGYLLARRWHLRWGATEEEIRRPMPGDELVPRVHLETTRAVTIEAPPESVFPWLVQMGYQRGGWYSYDRLDNQGVPSASRILPELQNLKVGDQLAPIPGGFIVHALDSPRSMVLVSKSKEGRIFVSWTFQVEPIGSGHSRFIERLRCRYELSPAGMFWFLFVEPADFIMMRKQMLNIKRRAEYAFASV